MERLLPYRKLVGSLLSINGLGSPALRKGTLAIFHCDGESIFNGICVPSKSSKYEAASPFNSIDFGEFGNRYAASARMDKFDGASVSIFGKWLTNFVKKGISEL